MGDMFWENSLAAIKKFHLIIGQKSSNLPNSKFLSFSGHYRESRYVLFVGAC